MSGVENFPYDTRLNILHKPLETEGYANPSPPVTGTGRGPLAT